MHRMQTTSLALLLLSLALGCNRQRPREGEAARVDTVMVFTAEGLGTYPQISDSSRLLPDRSFRFNPAAVPCPLRQDAARWPSTRVALPAGTPGRLTIHLPPRFEGRSSQGASWVVWQGDSTSIPPASFRVAFREPPQGYPRITIGGSRGQTQLLECSVPTTAGTIHVALFTIAWLNGRPERKYVVAYWDLLPGLPVQVFASGIGSNDQAEFLTSLRSMQYSDQ